MSKYALVIRGSTTVDGKSHRAFNAIRMRGGMICTVGGW